MMKKRSLQCCMVHVSQVTFVSVSAGMGGASLHEVHTKGFITFEPQCLINSELYKSTPFHCFQLCNRLI